MEFNGVYITLTFPDVNVYLLSRNLSELVGGKKITGKKVTEKKSRKKKSQKIKSQEKSHNYKDQEKINISVKNVVRHAFHVKRKQG